MSGGVGGAAGGGGVAGDGGASDTGEEAGGGGEAAGGAARDLVRIAAEGGAAAGRLDPEAVVESEEWLGGVAAELGQVGTGLGRNLSVDFGGHGGDNVVTLSLNSLWLKIHGSENERLRLEARE